MKQRSTRSYMRLMAEQDSGSSFDQKALFIREAIKGYPLIMQDSNLGNRGLSHELIHPWLGSLLSHYLCHQVVALTLHFRLVEMQTVHYVQLFSHALNQLSFRVYLLKIVSSAPVYTAVVRTLHFLFFSHEILHLIFSRLARGRVCVNLLHDFWNLGV